MELVNFTEDEHLKTLNHSCAHLMAQAVRHIWPDAKFWVGPVVEEGFYYDIDFKEPIVEADLAKIEKKMHELASKDERIVREVLSKEEALERFKNNPYKVELIKDINEDITIFTQGKFTDLCRGPHLLATGQIKYFKLLNLAGA